MATIVEMINPLTGLPEQVDKLDHTAQEIDDAADLTPQLSNPNLLDNWYFGNPVDQRQGRVVKPNTTYYSDNQLTTSAGTTSAYVTAYRYATGTASGVNYASFKLNDSDTAPTYYAAPENVVRGYTGVGYGIDRWSFDNDSGNATILLTESGIKFVNGSAATGISAMHQKINPELYSALAGKTITLSMLGKSEKSQQILLLVNGSILAANSSAGSNRARITTLTVTLPQTISGMRIYTYGASEAGSGEGYIKAAKLDLGTQQTLAHQDENGVWQLNEIPDYGEQLARCQRVLLPVEAWKCYSGRIDNEGAAYIEIPTPVSMRSGDGVPVIIGEKKGFVYHASGLKEVTYGVASFGANSVTIYASGIDVTNQVCSGCFSNKVFLSKEL